MKHLWQHFWYQTMMNLSHIEDMLETLMSDIKNNNYDIKDKDERKHQYVDELVSCNSTEENKGILEYLELDVYDIIELYEFEFGDKINARDKKHFYAIIAYWAILRKYFEEEKSEEEESEEEESETSTEEL